ncbi:MAG: trypsin-like peptidase domain-containing protein [Candidatus Babeliales bacterium]|jgi:serine protease Do
MNNALRRIAGLVVLLTSIGVVFWIFSLYRQHTAALSQLTSLVKNNREELSRKNSALAPARIISSKSGGTWLDVQKQVRDTVVQVYSHIAEFNWLEPYKSPDINESAGSGFFINDKGDIITNYHVIAQSCGMEIQIPSFGLERFDVTIIGVCPERDIALLRLTKDAHETIIQKNQKISWLKLGDSDLVLRSQEVLALGYPLGQLRLKSTLGIVSGREHGFIQITAPLNPGNSGGPALDTNGDVIGINSRGILEAQNVGYIIPINEVKSALKDLYKVKLLRKPTLGCIFTHATPEMVQYLGNPPQGGWYIAKIFEGTLLANLGVKAGDMLYQINGYDVDLYGDINVPWSEDKISLLEFLNRLMIGDTLNFVIYRKGVRKEFKASFKHTYLPPVRMIYPEFEGDAIDYEILGGMVVMPLSLCHVGILIQRVPSLVRYGNTELQHEPALVITNILPNSQASRARILRLGQIIEEVNDQKVKTLDDFRSAIIKSKKSRYITIRTDENFYAVLSVDKMLKEEEMLTARYFYDKSPLLKQLEINGQTPRTPKSNPAVE